MRDHEALAMFLGFFIGLALALLIYEVAQPAPSIDNTDGCVIVTGSGTILADPEPGEDDGLVYCPTGELSNSQLGKVVK